MNATMKTLLERRSIRAYKPDQIKKEELQIILEAGQFAPSGMNDQPWHFTVIQKKELLGTINEFIRAALLKSGNRMMEERAKAENFSIFYHAPTLILVSGDPKAMTLHFDCALALGSMFLAARSLDIGSCWIHAVAMTLGAEAGKAILQELGLPEGYVPVCSGAFGYSAEAPVAAPRKESTINIIQ